VADVMLSVESGVQLPPRIDNVVQVSFDMTPYRDLERNLATANVTAVNAAVLAGKLAQMANGAVYTDAGGVEEIHEAKLDALEEIVEQGEPVLCFTAYVHDQDRIKKRFPQAVVFDGERSLRAWQAGRIDLLLMHPASGGHGVDGLQVGGSVAVWFALPFSLDLYEQANARLHRSGQANQVTVHHLVATGTVDEKIMAVLAAKGDVQRALLKAVRDLKERATA
jgi:SNF2 family DNA or RNA helicase